MLSQASKDRPLTLACPPAYRGVLLVNVSFLPLPTCRRCLAIAYLLQLARVDAVLHHRCIRDARQAQTTSFLGLSNRLAEFCSLVHRKAFAQGLAPSAFSVAPLLPVTLGTQFAGFSLVAATADFIVLSIVGVPGMMPTGESH